MYSVGQKVRVVPGPHKTGEFYEGLVGIIVRRVVVGSSQQNNVLVDVHTDTNKPIMERAHGYWDPARPETMLWFNDHELEAVTDE